MSDTALIIGASRGLGHAIAAEFLGHGWDVVGTVRDPTVRTPLHELADEHPGRVGIAVLDITDQDELASLRERLAGRVFEVLFVNAGTTNDESTLIGDVTTEDFVTVMVTNALSPMRVVETLGDLVPDDGLIGAMTSGQGSITNNTTGMREVYRGSKAALNMYMRRFAVRQPAARALVLMAPGWVQTEMGGPGARLTIEESIPSLVTTVDAQRGRPGLQYLDYQGKTVPW
jgi:NAD(P)-dependent dehydrogenase (short-subunit alcohol dehydrogenase family)